MEDMTISRVIVISITHAVMVVVSFEAGQCQSRLHLSPIRTIVGGDLPVPEYLYHPAMFCPTEVETFNRPVNPQPRIQRPSTTEEIQEIELGTKTMVMVDLNTLDEIVSPVLEAGANDRNDQYNFIIILLILCMMLNNYVFEFLDARVD